MQLIQQKNAMQRDPSGGDQQRPGSPGSAENAPSPSKRPRLDGGGNGFNPQQMPNGRGQPMPQQVRKLGLKTDFRSAPLRYSMSFIYI